ncbi:MAG: glycosyltransferase family 39 protein [Actinomycetota bacterium]
MNRRELWIVAGITLAAALIRFATLDHQSFDHDEAVTAVRVLQPDFGDMLSVVGRLERSPPLYYILAWLWSKVFGTGEAGLRSMSALIGAFTVPAGYLAARELASSRAGVITAALVALNPYLVWYSQEARSYALFVFFAAWSLYFLARVLRDSSPRNLALWAGSSALAVCSHYFAAFVIIPEGLWLIVATAGRRRAILAVAGTAAVGLALLPLALAQEGSGRSNTFTDQSLFGRAREAGLNFVASEEPGWLAGSPSVDDLQRAAALLGVALVIGAVVLLVRWGLPVERLGAALAAGIGGVAVAIPFALALVGIDFIDPRNLIGSLIPLLVAGGIAFGVRRARPLGVAGAAVAASLFAAVLVAVYVTGQMQRDDWRGAAEAIGPPSGPRVLVVPKNGDDGLVYYLHAREFHRRRFRPGLPVREIDVLSKAFTVSPPRRGFRLVEQRGLAPSFILRRYRSSRPVRIRYPDVAGHQVLMERSKVLADGLGR